jgi:glutamyl-tRNA reductase
VSQLFVIGVSHRTAPVEVREALSLGEQELREQLRAAAGLCGEAMVLSTCNRYELYGRLPGGDDGREQLLRVESLLTRAHSAARDHLYRLHGEQAVRHLFRVASSLDSMVLGEPQILGQVKQAFQLAQSAGTVGSTLGALLPHAFLVAKRVRSETAIGVNSASVASVAVSLASQVFGQLRGQPVLLVGAGKMAELCARHLREASADQFLVVNRTRARAEELAARLRGTAHDFGELEALLARAAVVLCSTGAREPVLRADLLARVMKARKGRWLVLIDIAVPRDIEPQAGELDNVYLYDIDALQAVVAGNLAERQREAAAAEQIIVAELARAAARAREGGVVPVIKALRAYAQGVAQAEVARLAPRLGTLGERERKLVQQLADGIVNKLLHPPLTALKRAAAEPDANLGLDLAGAVRSLWPLVEAPPGVDYDEGSLLAEGAPAAEPLPAPGKR